MGHVYANILLQNSTDAGMMERGLIPDDKVRKMEVKALVDSGAMTLTINETIASRLDLEVKDQAKVSLADGTICGCDLVGPVDIRFQNRITSCLALVLPGADEVLLGVIPLEGMDVIIDPTSQQLVVHPDRPDRPEMKCK
jgi:clan AA aspartic protease